ncbi:hypothetical protein Tco_1284282, partial [Tanacetum coccineum]
MECRAGDRTDFRQNFEEGDMPFRRRSCSDGKSIIVGQLYRKITSKDGFRLLDDVDANAHWQRITIDEIEVGSPWWIASSAYFEGSNTDAPPVISPPVNRFSWDASPVDVYQRLATQDEKIKKLEDELKALQAKRQEPITQEPVAEEPMFVSEHCGLSNFSLFPNTQ